MKQLSLLLVLLCLAASGCSHLMPSITGEVDAPVLTVKLPESHKASEAQQIEVEQTVQRQELRAELDNDHDGVVDSIDECPNTPAQVAVDGFGCPVSLYLRTRVTFEPNEVVASERIMAQVRRIGQLLQQNPDSTAIVEGHTDDAGDSATNLQLSRQRAQSIKQLLQLMYEIDPSRVSAAGFGESRPLVSNATEQGRMRNRRVEITVSGYYQDRTSYIALNRPYNIHFDTGQTMISGAFKSKVDELGAYLSKNPGTTALIDGHTDNIGDPQNNMQLSRERANAVKQYLLQKYGVSPERLKVAGHGENQPIASNDTESGRFKNRRVTITVSRGNKPVAPEQSTYTSRLSGKGRLDTATYSPLDRNVTLHFAAENVDIDLRSARKIDELGLLLQKQPGLEVTIEGHAESGGSQHDNLQLSQQRAEKVKRYLQLRYDISPERLHTIGYGADLPVADASNAESVQIKVKRF